VIFVGLFLFLIFVFFAMVVVRGAPYVPTHKKVLQAIFDENLVKKGELVVDLGSGDGVFLKMLAQNGYRAVGYEINPFLCVISYLRCWRYRKQIKIYWRDFWLTSLPPGTKVVYVFLAEPFMQKFKEKITSEVEKLGQITVISNGFELPGLKTYKNTKALQIYKIAKTLQKGQ